MQKRQRKSAAFCAVLVHLHDIVETNLSLIVVLAVVDAIRSCTGCSKDLDYRIGHLLVLSQSLFDHVLLIVGTLNKLGATVIADTVLFRRIESTSHSVALSALAADTSFACALHHQMIGQINLDNCIRCKTVLDHSLGLSRGTRETIKDDGSGLVFELLLDDAKDDAVGNQVSGLHDSIDLSPQFGISFLHLSKQAAHCHDPILITLALHEFVQQSSFASSVFSYNQSFAHCKSPFLSHIVILFNELFYYNTKHAIFQAKKRTSKYLTIFKASFLLLFKL